MGRKKSKTDPWGLGEDEVEVAAEAPPCWLCARSTGKTIVWHHPIPKSRGGRETVPMHPVCQNFLIANFSMSELQRHGMDAASLLAEPVVAKFVSWIEKKDPDFTAPLAKKQR